MIKKLTALFAAVFLVSCSSSQVSSPTYMGASLSGSSLKVVVLPFTNYSSNANAGRIVAQMLAAELQNSGNLTVLEEIPSDNKLSKANVDMGKIHEIGYAAKAARALGVDAVLFGAVSEYGYKLSLREEAAVSINARLVSKKGELLWSLSSSDQEGFWFRSSLGMVAQKLAADMADNLKKAAE